MSHVSAEGAPALGLTAAAIVPMRGNLTVK